MLKVVVVEDELNIRQGICDFVEHVVSGFKVVGQAANGYEALELMRSTVPDLLITDIRMSEMNGLELIKRLHQRYTDMKILIISAYNEFEYAQQALRYGAADYMLKPIDRIQLTQFLNKLKQESIFRATSEETEHNRRERQVIRSVKDWIHANLQEEITLRKVAEEVYMNPKYLSVFFKSETGVHFSDYVEHCRIAKAKKLLKETRLKIYEVAELCGYASAKHFMVVFKQAVRCTPTEFRDMPDTTGVWGEERL
jgi:YesN/AraC family two-component response regulator